MTERYFHGGVSGLEVGDLILPPSETGVAASADLLLSVSHERVYLALEPQEARVYAAICNGDLYEVEPLGTIEFDVADQSVAVRSARVTDVLERGVPRIVAIEAMKSYLRTYG